MQKKTLALVFGGRSAEHEVSVRSTRNVLAAIDQATYQVILIGIDKAGGWHLATTESLAKNSVVSDDAPLIALLPNGHGRLISEAGPLDLPLIDVVFPVIHGPFGEDGTLQGILEIAGVPYVGAGVLGSAVGMDKDVMKRLLKEAGIPIGRYLAAQAGEPLDYQLIAQELGPILFIKPANLGSSVGISKVHNQGEFEGCVREAFLYDQKIMIEEGIEGRELECAVLGNSQAEATAPGEIIPHHEFYSYEAKYLDEDGAGLVIPARVETSVVAEVKKMALAAFRALNCAGLARVDFFLTKDGRLLLNEINTLPGFTSISMYPKLWENQGVSYAELIQKLIGLALERFARVSQLKTDVDLT